MIEYDSLIPEEETDTDDDEMRSGGRSRVVNDDMGPGWEVMVRKC